MSVPARTMRLLVLACGRLAYLLFLGSIGYLVAFNAGVGVAKTVDAGDGAPGPALLVDLVLIAAFGAQHSVMARAGFKRRLARLLPEAMERSVFVLASSVALVLLLWGWRPIPAIVWHAESPAAAAILRASSVAGWLLALAATFVFSHRELFGLRQSAAYARGRAHEPLGFRMPALYRVVRHPMHAGVLLAMWAIPTMTLGHLVLALGMSAYVLIGIRFEERQMTRSFGEAYQAYRRQVPGLVPLLRPAGSTALVAGGAVLLLGLVAVRAHSARAAEHRVARPVLVAGSLEVDGLPRTYSVLNPARPAARPGIVLAFHGTGGTGAQLHGFAGVELARQAEAHGFLVAFPDAAGGAWNDCRAGGGGIARRSGVDDVAFARALVGRLAAERGADPRRVHAFGFSGGGHMAYRLALEGSGIVRSAAAVAASLPVDSELTCRAGGTLPPVMIVNGTADLVNPDGGGTVITPWGAALGHVRSSRETAEYLAGLAGADRIARVDVAPGQPGARTTVERSTWSGRDGEAVALYTVRSGGHTIPGPRSRMPWLLGPLERGFDAVGTAVTFFAHVERTRKAVPLTSTSSSRPRASP